MKHLFGLLLTAILLISCEGSTSIKFSILNNTSGNLKVYYSYTNSTGLDSTEVTMGNTHVLYEVDLLGGNGDSYLPTEFFDTIVIVNASMDTMQKDFSQGFNWKDQIDQLKKFPPSFGHEYTLEVTDADF